MPPALEIPFNKQEDANYLSHSPVQTPELTTFGFPTTLVFHHPRTHSTLNQVSNFPSYLNTESFLPPLPRSIIHPVTIRNVDRQDDDYTSVPVSDEYVCEKQ